MAVKDFKVKHGIVANSVIESTSGGFKFPDGTTLASGANIILGASSLTTAGSIPYVSASGVLSQDAGQLHWDATNNRLGIGTNTPTDNLSVIGSNARFDIWDQSGTPARFAITAYGQTNQGVSLGTRTNVPMTFEINSSNATTITTNRNVLIGTVTDGNFRLDVGSSGSAGTARFYDQTATTGSTKVVVRAGAGQSTTNLQEWQISDGTVRAAINNAGDVKSSKFIDNGSDAFALQTSSDSTSILRFASAKGIAWSNDSTWYGTKDVGIVRNSAGVLEVNNGTANTYRDLRLRTLVTNSTIYSPEGAYFGGNSSETGAFKIKMPVAALDNNTMMTMVVKIYNYVTGTSTQFEIGGYNFQGGSWFNVYAIQRGDTGSRLKIRFGRDATSNCIWIGETTSTWSWVKVIVTEFHPTHSNDFVNWRTGWAISVVTSFDTVQSEYDPAFVLNDKNYTNYNTYPSLIVSGNLTVDTNTLFVDSVNNRVGVGTITPTHSLQVNGTIKGESSITAAGAIVSDNGTFISAGGVDTKLYGGNGAAGIALLIKSATGSILVGGVSTESNFKLDVAASGSAGTARFYDQTATTGVTKVQLRAGAGQSSNYILDVLNNSGNSVATINSSGFVSDGIYGHGILLNGGGGPQILSNSVRNVHFVPQGIRVVPGSGLYWNSVAFETNTILDTGIARNAAGVVEINNGNTGVYRDLQLRAINPTSGNVGIGNTAPTHTLRVEGTFSASGNANVGNIGATNAVITGNMSLGNVIAGNLTLGSDALTSSHHTITIDPSTAGVGGNVIVQGNLQVTGTTTTVNSTTLEVTDLNITLAKDAVNAAAANGAGLTVAGASATMTYASTGDKWTFNKPLDVTGSLTASTTLSVTGNANVGNIGSNNAVFTGTLNVTGNSTQGNITTGNVITYGQFGTPIKLRVLSDNSLSFDGSSGQLFSITDTLTGDIFSVNDITGLPSIRVDSNATVYLAEISGNVGIGNVAPAHKLSVTGTMNVSGNANVGNLGAAAGVFSGNISAGNINSVSGILSVTGNANVGNIGATRGVFTNVVGTLETAAQTNITSIGTLSSLTVSGNATFDTNTLFVDSVNNRVGIGTASPSTGLHFYESGNPTFRIEGTNVPIIRLIGSGGAGTISQYTDNTVRIGAYSNSATTQLVLAGNTGNIGINTINPVYPLHIQPVTTNTSGVNNLLRVGTESTTPGCVSRIAMFVSPDPVADTNGGKIFIDAIRTANMDLAISLNDVAGAAPVERFRISGSGNVGIGNAAPTHTLRVEGTVSATGNANVGNIGATNANLIALTVTGNASIGNISSTTATFTTNVANVTTYNVTVNNSNNSSTPGSGIGLYTISGFAGEISTVYVNGHSLFKIRTPDSWNSGNIRERYQIFSTSGGANIFQSWFRGDGTESLRLTHGGNLLIGTTTDDGVNKLQVNGGIQVGVNSNQVCLSLTNNGAFRTGTAAGNFYFDLGNVHFRMGDASSSNYMVFRGGSTGHLLLGTSTDDTVSKLQVAGGGDFYETTTNAARGLNVSQHIDGLAAAVLTLRKSRGTKASPTIVSSGDYIGGILFSGYGSSYINSAGMSTRATGTVTTSSVPIDFFIYNSGGTNVVTGDTDSALIIKPTRNVIIGNDFTETNFAFDIKRSGSAGTARFYDQTATTGSTKLVIRAGAGQSTNNLIEWYDSVGSLLARCTNNATLMVPAVVDFAETSFGLVSASGAGWVRGLNISVNSSIGFTSSSLWYTGLDLGIKRNAAGVLEINNGTAGTYRDLILRNITSSNGQISSTRSNETATGSGQIYLNGANGNRIDFNTNGVAAPSFTTRSVGTKIVLYPEVSGAAVDYAIGIDGNTLWFSVPDTGRQFKWYGGTTNVATLTGTGNFTLAGNLTVDTDTLFVDSVNNRVGISISAPTEKLHVAGKILVSNGSSLYIDSNVNGAVVALSSNLPISFETNSVTRMRITGSGDVGIGTTSPAYKLEVNGSFAATTKSFVIDHPTKSGMKLRYGSLEGPENGVYVRGRSSSHVIDLPEYWSKLVDPDSITVTITPIGLPQSISVAQYNNQQVILNGVEGEYFFTVFAERIDVEKLTVEFEA